MAKVRVPHYIQVELTVFINQPKPVPGLSEQVKLWIQPKRYVL